MKKLLLILFMAVSLPTCLSVNAQGVIVPLICEIYDQSSITDKPARGPVAIPSVSIDSYTLYINSSHPDCTVQLVDEDDEVVYEVFVAENVSTVQLPTVYSGEYRLNILWGNWCFWGYINL